MFSVSGDARVAASHSVVVGQIHSADGHENEPLKNILLKNFLVIPKGRFFGIMKSIQQERTTPRGGIIQLQFGDTIFQL